MKTVKKAQPATVDVIKLKIDYRTIITVKSKEALKNWLQRYPEAKIVA